MFKTQKQTRLHILDISNEQFDQMKNKAIIFDVRDETEFQMLTTIANPNNELNIINVPYLELIKNPSTYIENKDITIITICNAGNRSTLAALALYEQGYENTYVLRNGIYDYNHK